MRESNNLNNNCEFIIKAEKVSFYLEGQPIFQDLDFHLNRGEVYMIVGASGSGKSLLLKILSGLLPPTKGIIQIAGIDLAKASPEDIQKLRQKMGFIFQDAALISNMCLYDNIALPLRYHTPLSEKEVAEKVAEQMALWHIDRQGDFLLPAQLSLETRKRAALARALILDPDLLFLDEPATGLASEAATHIWKFLKEYHQKKGATLLLVQSEWRSASFLADRIGFLKEGKIVEQGNVREMKDYLEKIPVRETFSS